MKMPAVTSAGFSNRTERGNDLPQSRDGGLGKRRQHQAALHRAVGEHDTRAARDRQHADVATLWHPAVRHQLGDVDDRLDVVDLDQAGLAERGAVEVGAAGHVGGVRLRRLGTDLGRGALPDQHRLAEGQRLAAELDQAAGVRRAFHHSEHQVRAGIVEERRQQLRHRHIGLVARRDAVPEPHALRLGEIDDGIAEAARLERAGYAARLQLGLLRHRPEHRPHPLLQRDQALAVRTDQPHVGLASHLLELGFELGAGRAGLAESGGKDDGEADAGCATVTNRLSHQRGRHGYDGDVAWRLDRGAGRKACQAGDLGITRIDRKDPALVAGPLQRPQRVTADPGRIRRRADDCYAARMEQAFEAHFDVNLFLHQ